MKWHIHFVIFLLVSCLQMEGAISKNVKILSLSKYKADFERMFEPVPKEVNLESPSCKIPKIIHQIWIGSPLPSKFVWMTESWKNHHPDWTYILWTDEKVAKLKLKNQKAYDLAVNYGAKADILRYELLERFGGLYVDIDYECLKAFDQIHASCDFYACALHKDTIANALIGSIPHHPVIERCVTYLNKVELNTNKAEVILEEAGPHYFTRQVLYHVFQDKKSSIRLFKPSFSFPMPSGRRFAYWKGEISVAELNKYRNSSAFALHYWATSWQQTH